MTMQFWLPWCGFLTRSIGPSRQISLTLWIPWLHVTSPRLSQVITLDLSFSFPINNIISLSPWLSLVKKPSCDCGRERLRLIEDALLSLSRERKRAEPPDDPQRGWLLQGTNAASGLGGRQRHIMWPTKHRKDTVRDHAVQTWFY